MLFDELLLMRPIHRIKNEKSLMHQKPRVHYVDNYSIYTRLDNLPLTLSQGLTQYIAYTLINTVAD